MILPYRTPNLVLNPEPDDGSGGRSGASAWLMVLTVAARETPHLGFRVIYSYPIAVSCCNEIPVQALFPAPFVGLFVFTKTFSHARSRMSLGHPTVLLQGPAGSKMGTSNREPQQCSKNVMKIGIALSYSYYIFWASHFTPFTECPCSAQPQRVQGWPNPTVSLQ